MGLRPWLAFFLRARSVAFFVRFDIGVPRYRRAAGVPKPASVPVRRGATFGAVGVQAWADLDVVPVAGQPGRYTSQLSDPWMLVSLPQGGIVAAVAASAMAAELGDPNQILRTATCVFAGQVAGGPIDIEVQVLRRGRSMSQLQATVTNPGATAGLTLLAAFGGPRRGFEFTQAAMPEVDGPDGLRSYRDDLPEGIDFEFDRPPMPFWNDVLECRPALARAPWEPFVESPAERAYWYRLDDPPLQADGTLDPLAAFVLCDTMPGAVDQRVGPVDGGWFGPSVDLTLHLFGSATPGWLLAHNTARWAGDGYASVDMALWDPREDRLVAYATQLMFFAFGV